MENKRYDMCSICGKYAQVGKYGGKDEVICIRCLNGGKSYNKPFVKVKTPGRNDPCDCGSGLKYKKCCIGNQPKIDEL
jgi:uncharacterized protein YchJ